MITVKGYLIDKISPKGESLAKVENHCDSKILLGSILYRYGLIFTFGENHLAGPTWPASNRLDTLVIDQYVRVTWTTSLSIQNNFRDVVHLCSAPINVTRSRL